MPPLLTKEGDVLIQWVQSQHIADTVTLYSGSGYTRDFLPGHGLLDPRIAIYLRDLPHGGMLHSIRAYFRANPTATRESWEASASFRWSLHPDSAGLPAVEPIASETWDLTDDSLMFGGYWMQNDVDWWLPATYESGFWLVGSWEEGTEDLVLLGADFGALPEEVMLGTACPGSVCWTRITDPGLLVELTLLPSGRGEDRARAGSLNCGSSTYANGAGFTISREIIAGAMSPRLTHAVVEDSLPWVWRDTTAVVGQELRYTVAEILPGGGAAQGTTVDFAVDPRWPFYVFPEELRQSISLNPVTDFTFIAVNGANDTLFLNPAPPVLEAHDSPPGGGAKPVIVTQVTPAVGNIPPADSQFVVFQVDAQGAPPGEYEGLLLLRVQQPSLGMAQKWGIPVYLTLDLATSVETVDPYPSGSNTTGQSGLEIHALGNPFGNRVSLRIALPYQLTSGSVSTSKWGGANDASMAEITLYDTRGRRILRRNEPVGMQTGPDGMGTAEVSLTGLAHWPSGMYFCRVRIADRVGVIKLCHVK